MSLKAQIIALHQANPDWCPQQIAVAIGRGGISGAAYVRHVARDEGLQLPRSPQGPTPRALRDKLTKG